MTEHGFSLMEMVVAIAVMGILTAIATHNFREYSRHYQTEKQTRMIYSELIHARLCALNQRRGRVVKLYRTHFDVYSSTVDNGNGAAPLFRRALTYPVCGMSEGYQVSFDDRGISFNENTICVDDPVPTGAVDSIVLSPMRMRMGKRGAGKECDAKYVTE